MMKHIKMTQKKMQNDKSSSRTIAPTTAMMSKSTKSGQMRDEELLPNGLTISQDDQLRTMKDELTRK